MLAKLEAVGAGLLARLVPETEAQAATCKVRCVDGWYWWCCKHGNTWTCTDRSESPC
ncbi:hypothetical protein ACFZBU_43370 [Embleya sp. NPDC008237]|uniref:hypothetical protein n=1 Tax=unclassified Embleya TaxID=2699296 RepID=UPI0036EB6E8B